MAVKLRLQKAAAKKAQTTDRIRRPRYGQAKRRARRKFFMARRLPDLHAETGTKRPAVVSHSQGGNKVGWSVVGVAGGWVAGQWQVVVTPTLTICQLPPTT